MISAFEARNLSRENYEKNKAVKLNRLVKESERRIEEAVESGLGYIAINHDLEEFDELCEHFDAFGYKAIGVSYYGSSFNTKYYLVWDEEKFEKEIVINGGKKFFEGKQHDTRRSNEIPF